MTIARYLEILDQELGVQVGLADDEAVVSDTLPRLAADALARYEWQVVAFLRTGRDEVLHVEDPQALGLCLIPETGEWTSAAGGDEEAERLIAGLIAPLVDTPRTARQRELFNGKRVRMPRRVFVEAERVAPGLYRWHEPKGVVVVPMFNGRRLIRG